VDAAGARELRRRFEAQEHWQQAEAVRHGEQPATDPDGHELEELGKSLRLYGRESHQTTIEGQPAIVTQRLCKRLTAGRWETSLEVERVRYLEDMAADDS
jgi:hypothetical protein